MCNVHIKTNFSHVQIAGLLKKPWRQGSTNSPGSLLVSSPLPPWRGATPREPSSRPRQGVGGATRGSQGPVSDQLYSSVWQERKMRRRRQNILLISTCNFFHVVLWGWKYIHVEPRYLTRLLLLLRSGVVFEWLWNNSVAVSISRAPVSETGMMNSFWPHCTMYIVHI